MLCRFQAHRIGTMTMYTIPHQYAIATLFMVYATDNGDLNGLNF